MNQWRVWWCSTSVVWENEWNHASQNLDNACSRMTLNLTNNKSCQIKRLWLVHKKDSFCRQLALKSCNHKDSFCCNRLASCAASVRSVRRAVPRYCCCIIAIILITTDWLAVTCTNFFYVLAGGPSRSISHISLDCIKKEGCPCWKQEWWDREDKRRRTNAMSCNCDVLLSRHIFSK